METICDRSTTAAEPDGGHAPENAEAAGPLNGHVSAPVPAGTVLTVRLGTHRNAETLLASLSAKTCRISESARTILASAAFGVAPVEIEIELLVLSLADLGLKKRARYADICRAGRRRGHELCPVEAVIALYREHKAQPPRGTTFVAAMPPLSDADGTPGVLTLTNLGGRRWLTAAAGGPKVLWPDLYRYRYVFMQRP